MRFRTIALASGALITTVLVLTGCAQSSTTGAMPGMDHGSTPMTPSESTSDVNFADQTFVTMMIPHHEQAVEMSGILLAKPDMPADMVDLATSIAAEQGPEIEQMQQWQEDWGLPEMPGMNHGGHGGMDGMLSEEELDELRDAEGDGAVTLFLEQMIAHHEGAIDMAQDVVDRGEHADVIAMATAIIESQRAEIALMNEMLGR